MLLPRFVTCVPTVVIAVSAAYSCEPFTASVLAAVTRPAATLVIWRGAADVPTLTTPAGVPPA